MAEFFYLFRYLLSQTLGLGLAVIVGGVFIYLMLRRMHSLRMTLLFIAAFFGLLLFLFLPLGAPQGWQYPFFLRTYGPATGPVIPLHNLLEFFVGMDDMERVADIAADPANVLPPLNRTAPDQVSIELEVKEVMGEMADGVIFNYWTFNGTVPGPLLRVREGDTVTLTLKNHPTSIHDHSIDLHAVTGPGGGAVATNVSPGQSKTFTFKALNPGAFVYHCAHTNTATHMAHGMYGMIIVEPEEGLSPVDKEFYVMQGEFYSSGELGKKGLQIFDATKMLHGDPEYIVFNGRTGGVNGKMEASVGETVRIYFGNGGVNEISSFHLIGEIFDRVYPEAAMGNEPHQNIQSTLVPAGGATIVEFRLEVPGNYILVDHALARMDRGAWGVLTVTGGEDKTIFDGFADPNTRGH